MANGGMKLSRWITEQGLSVAEAARRAGIEGVNPQRTLARLASGERDASTEQVARIERLTGGAVTAQDMHETRLAWLQANRPQVLDTLPRPAATEEA